MSSMEIDQHSSMISKVGNFLKNPWTILYVLLCLGIFISLGYYVYYYYVSPQIKSTYVENKELVNDTKDKNAYLYLFSTEWCPHCKELCKKDGVWEKIKNNDNSKKINNHNIMYVDINGDDEKRVTEFETEYKVKVDGFPSIYLVKDDQIVEFDANPSEDSLNQFLNTVV
jgi:thiol-disulfide isomerase/thioredoxin